MTDIRNLMAQGLIVGPAAELPETRPLGTDHQALPTYLEQFPVIPPPNPPPAAPAPPDPPLFMLQGLPTFAGGVLPDGVAQRLVGIVGDVPVLNSDGSWIGSSAAPAGPTTFQYYPSPGLGNLVISDSSTGGTDQFGNPYTAGVATYSVLSNGNPFAFTNSNGTVLMQEFTGGSWVTRISLAYVSGQGLYISAGAVILGNPLVAQQPGSSPPVAETWHTMTLQNSWGTVAGWTVPSYQLTPEGSVLLAGRAAQATDGTQVIATLPAAYRPTTKQVTALAIASGTITAAMTPRLQLGTDGTVTPFGVTGATTVSMDGALFPLALNSPAPPPATVGLLGATIADGSGAGFGTNYPAQANAVDGYLSGGSPAPAFPAPGATCQKTFYGVGSNNWSGQTTASFSATLGSPCVFTVTGGLANGTTCILTGSLPTGFATNTVYWVVGASGNTFNLAATKGGTGINSASGGGGTVYNFSLPTRDAAYITLGARLVVSLRPWQAVSDSYSSGSNLCSANNQGSGSPPPTGWTIANELAACQAQIALYVGAWTGPATKMDVCWWQECNDSSFFTSGAAYVAYRAWYNAAIPGGNGIGSIVCVGFGGGNFASYIPGTGAGVTEVLLDYYGNAQQNDNNAAPTTVLAAASAIGVPFGFGELGVNSQNPAPGSTGFTNSMTYFPTYLSSLQTFLTAMANHTPAPQPIGKVLWFNGNKTINSLGWSVSGSTLVNTGSSDPKVGPLNTFFNAVFAL